MIVKLGYRIIYVYFFVVDRILNLVTSSLKLMFGVIIEPRNLVDYFVDREDLLDVRSEIKDELSKNFPEEDLKNSELFLDYKEADRYVNQHKALSKARFESQKITLTILGSLVYYFFSIRVLAIYATFFGLEVLLRKHVSVIIEYYNIYQEDSDFERYFKNQWNASALNTPYLYYVMASAAMKTQNLHGREYFNKKMIQEVYLK